MFEEPSISVIMPVYNTKESYLTKAIESVLSQTLSDFEFIIVNDGSTTDVEEVILSYDDNRIKYMIQSQGGQSKARNTAIKRAVGKYIFYIDADDWIEPNALEESYNKAKKDNLDILLFGTYAHYESINEVRIWSGELNFFQEESTILSGESPEIHECLFIMNQACWGKLFKKDFLISNNLFFKEGLIFEDLDILFRYILKAKKIGALKKELYHYNVSIENSTTGTGNEKHFDLFKIFELVEETLIEYGLFEKLKLNFYDLKILLYNHRYERIFPELKERFKQSIINDFKNTKLQFFEVNKLKYKNEVYELLITMIKNQSKIG